MSGQRRVVVLGGGISALTFSYYLNLLKKTILSVQNAQLPQITVLEKGKDVGGWMKSHQDPTTGAVFSYGPRSLRAVGTEARSSMAMVEELGLAEEVISVTRTQPAGKTRLIYSQGKLHALPTGVLGLFTRLPFLSKSLARVALSEMRTGASAELKHVDESVHSFLSRRFGVDVAERLADPFLRGVIAGDVKQTSVKAMFPRLKAAEDEYGSVILNFSKIPEQTTGKVEESVLCRRALDEKWAMWNLKSGLGAIPLALHKTLLDEQVDIRTNCECTEIERRGDGFLVHTGSGVLEADVVVSAINAKSIAKLISNCSQTLSTKLSSLPIVDVATVTLEYPKNEVLHIPQAFGHLIPSGEGENNLGVIYESVVFPHHDRDDKSTTRLTVMIGGAWFNEVLGSNPTLSDVEDVAAKSVAKQLNITAAPVNVVANIIREAIPQYPVGHADVIQSIDKQIEEDSLPLTLIGPSFDNPGANHCIHRAKVQAMDLLTQWDSIDYRNSYSSSR